MKLARNLELPARAITESIAIMGRKGAGKTYTGGKLFEVFHAAGAQCVALDPVGNWWGLRLSKTGKGKGLDIPVFGGDHGDIPITPEAGALLARVIVERRVSCVVDLMPFRKAQRKRFVTDFATELFELKKRQRSPLHLFLEEARKFVPQKPFGDENVMLGAFEDIVRQGRNYGVGVSLLDQRPQSVNKEVLSQSEILIIHQLTGRHERKAIEEWVRDKAADDVDALAQLHELHSGEAFFWSPGLMRRFARIKVARKRTYDASSTPELGAGDEVAEPRPLSAGDLAELREGMSAIVAEVEASDPKKLRAELAKARKRIAELEQRPAEPTLVQVRSIAATDIAAIANEVDSIRSMGVSLTEAIRSVGGALETFRAAAEKAAPERALPTAAARVNARTIPAPASARGSRGHGRGNRMKTAVEDLDATFAQARLTGPEQKILNAIAWWESVGIAQPLTTAVAFIAGYSPKGGAFNNPKGRLRSKGLVKYLPGKRIVLAAAGADVAEYPLAPGTQDELHAAVLERLKGPERRILEPLLEAYPDPLSNEELAERAGYSAKGGAFNNPKGRLRTLELIKYPERGVAVASDFLFFGGGS